MIILIGPSASGKTEVAKELVRDFGYNKVITYTTREIRVNEINDIDYHFISKDDFINKLNNGFFFEYICYNGNYYGTAKSDLNDKSVVVLEPNGFKAYYNSDLKNVISFYLDSTVDKRIERMKFRKDPIEKIMERVKNDDLVFDPRTIEGLSYIMNSNDLTITELSKEINKLYITFKK